MPNKKISQFSILQNPSGDAIFPVVLGTNNYALPLSGLTGFLNPILAGNSYITGGTYNNNTGTLNITNATGGTIQVSGFTTGDTNVKHWIENRNKTVASDETIVISGNYVLSGTNLTLESSNLNISIGNINFNKYAQIFIGGYLLLIDSNIVNNGLISVAGACIMSGNSTITGTGIII
jgi:hypothetical protein